MSLLPAMDVLIPDAYEDDFIEFFEIAQSLGLPLPALQGGVGYELILKVDNDYDYTNLGIYASETAARVALCNWVVEQVLNGACFWIEDPENENNVMDYLKSNSDEKLISDFFTNWDSDEYEIKKIVVKDESHMEFLNHRLEDEKFIAELFATHYKVCDKKIVDWYKNLAHCESRSQKDLIPGSKVYISEITLDFKYNSVLGYSAFAESGYRIVRNWVVREWNNMGIDFNDDYISTLKIENQLLLDLGDKAIVDYYFDNTSEDKFSIVGTIIQPMPEKICF
jgi:hypothetical protein